MKRGDSEFLPGVLNGWMAVKMCLSADYKNANPYSRNSLVNFVKLILRDRGFHYVVWLRLCLVRFMPVRLTARIFHRVLSTIYGIQIPVKTKIGKGFRINHGTGLVINETAVIMENVVMHQFTTIGTWKKHAATIGNNVMIGPGVNIVENVMIGNNVIIGAGSVVVKDVPDGCTVAGNPARIITQLSKQ